MSSARAGWTERGRGRRRGLRTTLLLGMLVPVLGVAVSAGFEIRDRLDSREASAALDAEAAELAEIADFLAALAHEDVYSNLAALTADLELGDERIDVRALRAQLADARAVVDGPRFADLREAIDLADALLPLRAALDAGTVGFDEERRRFTAVDDLMETAWRDAMARVERSSDAEPLPAVIRARVRSLREAMRTFSFADDRIQHAVSLILGPPQRSDLHALLESTSRFELSRAAAEADAGPRAAEGWARFAAEPAVARTEDTIELATAVGWGDAPPVTDVDPTVWVQGLGDGAVWATGLTDVVRAAALDLQHAAAERASADSRAVAVHVLVLAGLIVASAALAATIARRVARPASALESAARRIEAGEFDMPALDPSGPRELAATVHAFNDMASTLAAVEAHAVALAEDPVSPVLDEPLPGRTGHAMQQAIDHLRASVNAAEAHRIELYELATHDALTGLLNRSAAFTAIERELARANRAGDELLALYVDLDGLKVLNDTYGHETGDDAIVRTADVLRATTRAADIVARLGGDEFLVVGPVPPEGRDGIASFAERIRAAVGLQAVGVDDGLSIPLRCSIGVVRAAGDVASPAELVRAADAAMYRAKHGGRNRVVWLDDADPHPA